MRAFAFGAVEYDAGRISEIGQISYIREHGDCIVKKEAPANADSVVTNE